MKSMMTIAALLTLSFGANAAGGEGVVHFKGTVINAPCGIAPESADQTIDFGQISKVHLNSGGRSIQKPVDIKLVNCDFSGVNPTKTVAVHFTGKTANNATDLGVSQTNAIIHLAAQDGTLVTFDGTSKSNETKLMDGSNTLHYQAWVEKGKTDVVEGEFSAEANFSLAYN
ncbi:fimbrial protein [Escherichia coli]|uniref:fimbrial protein n=1 Tax=Escherichia coli TaxID=562 RepID=UPI0039E18BD7